MIDYDLSRVGSQEDVILSEQIQTVDKTRLRKYIGILTSDFMKEIDRTVDISLHLNGETIAKQKKIYIEESNAMAKVEIPREQKDLNMNQIELLSFVDIKELMKISKSNSTDEIKAQEILNLFGFDFKENGVQILLKAIIASPKNSYFNLEKISEIVSQTEDIEKEEVKRLIIARVKENFKLKKAQTIDFIRLVNIFLLKKENNYEY